MRYQRNHYPLPRAVGWRSAAAQDALPAHKPPATSRARPPATGHRPVRIRSMRRMFSAVALAVLLSALAAAATPTISPEELLGHIKFLASDELKGRGGGTPELDRA